MIIKILLALLLSFSIQATPYKVNNPTEVVHNELDVKIHAARTLVAIYTDNNPMASQMFEETVSHWVMYQQQDNSFDVNTLLKAISFAVIKYDGQHHKDPENTPSIVYSIGLARVLFDEGKVTNVNILTSAILEDVLENTDTQPEEIQELFGDRVLQTVQEILSTSGDDNLSQLSLNAQMIKMAQRICDIRKLQQETLPDEYVYGYKLWGQQLLNSLKGTNPDLEAILQKEILS